MDIRDPASTISRLLLIWYAMFQAFHALFNGRYLLQSGPLPFAPPPGGWHPQLVAFLNGAAAADFVNAILSVVFVAAFFRRARWSVWLGTVTLTVSLYSAIVFTWGIVEAGAWRGAGSDYFWMYGPFVPVLVLFAAWSYWAGFGKLAMIRVTLPLLAVVVAASVLAAADAPAIVKSEFVFETAPFASAHASTIVETKDGLVAAWFGGTREGAEDVGIWLARHVTGAWTAPIEVATGVQPDRVRYPCWNPVLFQMADNTLALFYKVGPSPQQWWGMVRTSRDNGRTWSDARRLPDGILGPIKNKPVRLSDGTLLAGSSTESPARPSVWRVHFERSADAGRTWTVVRPAPSDNPNSPIDAIQPSILVHAGGRLQAIGRTRSGRIFETWSRDRGRSWTPIALTPLPNPSSGIDAATLGDGRHVVVYNHTSRGRSPLNLAVSRDGATWDAALVLESEPGEYSYPAVIQAAGGLLHVTYTWKRQRIKHVVIDPAKFTPVPMSEGAWPASVR